MGDGETLQRLCGVAVHGATTLHLVWDDGHCARVDLREVTASMKALAPLKKKREFASAIVNEGGWSIAWPSGVEFGAGQLRRCADEQAGEAMAPAAFRAWMQRHALTQEGAAAALGLSRRMIAYYASGEKVIPKTVLLATVGWEKRVEA